MESPERPEVAAARRRSANPDGPDRAAESGDAGRAAASDAGTGVHDPPGSPAHESSATRGRTALRWGLAGFVATPLTVLPHELGHYLTDVALGLQDVTLHYASVSWSGSGAFWDAVRQGDFGAADEIAPVVAMAVSAGMGPVATYLVVLACCVLCAKWRPHPLLVAIGYLSNIRAIGPGSVFLLELLGFGVSSGCDECRVSMLTGIPLGILVLPAVVSLVGAWIWLFRYFPRRHRRIAVASLVLGLPMGLAVYAFALGPLLLP